MIYYHKENITKTQCDAIAHGVNCQGVMGSGVALAIRNKWPEVYTSYIQFCETATKGNIPKLGLVNIVETEGAVIGNCFTQLYYGRDGKRYASKEAIEKSLTDFCRYLVHFHPMVETIAIPKIGCGLGGLEWESEILPVIEKLDIDFPFNFHVYDNNEKPA